MSPFYRKKRRAPSGPSKNEKKVLRSREASHPGDESDTLGRKFPWIETLSIALDFITPQQQLLEQESRTFQGSDVCDFTASCPGRCGGEGTFDFSAKIASAAGTRQASAEANGTCQQPLFAGSRDACGMHLTCRISFTYHPERDN